MNRRDLFKRAGTLGAGLGLAAVVGKGVTPQTFRYSERQGDAECERLLRGGAL